MGNEEDLIGLGIVGIVAYLYVRGKGDSSLLENKFEQAIAVEKTNKIIPDILSGLRSEIQDVPIFRRFKPEQTAIIGRINQFNEGIRRKETELVNFQQSLNLNETLKL